MKHLRSQSTMYSPGAHLLNTDEGDWSVWVFNKTPVMSGRAVSDRDFLFPQGLWVFSVRMAQEDLFRSMGVL